MEGVTEVEGEEDSVRDPLTEIDTVGRLGVGVMVGERVGLLEEVVEAETVGVRVPPPPPPTPGDPVPLKVAVGAGGEGVADAEPAKPEALGEPLPVPPAPPPLALPRLLPVALPLPLALALTDERGDLELTPDTEGDLEEVPESEGEREVEGDTLGLLELVLAREVAMAVREMVGDGEGEGERVLDLDDPGELEVEGLRDPPRRLGVKEGETVAPAVNERVVEGDRDPPPGDTEALEEVLDPRESEGKGVEVGADTVAGSVFRGLPDRVPAAPPPEFVLVRL